MSTLSALRDQQQQLNDVMKALESPSRDVTDTVEATHTWSSFESHTEITRVITVLRDNQNELVALKKTLQDKEAQLQVMYTDDQCRRSGTGSARLYIADIVVQWDSTPSRSQRLA